MRGGGVNDPPSSEAPLSPLMIRTRVMSISCMKLQLEPSPSFDSGKDALEKMLRATARSSPPDSDSEAHALTTIPASRARDAGQELSFPPESEGPPASPESWPP